MKNSDPAHTFLKPHRLFWVLFTGLAVFHLIQINKQPLQPWDESLYAVRVKYIVETNHWFDQTPGSVGGLYSSSQPPLQIWLSAATATVTGLNLFSLRIWPLLFSLGTLLLVFYFFEDKKNGLIAALLLGTIPFYAAYSRLGQLDMAFVFFYTAGLFFIDKYFKKLNKYFLLFAGIMAGLAFMSKMWMGIILLMALAIHISYLMIRHNKQIKKAALELALITLPALIIALPWHLWMYARHGSDFLLYFFSFHVLQRVISGVEHNTVDLGPLFYFNQLLVMISAAWIFIFLSFIKRKKLNRQEVLLWIFALVPLLVFTLSSTKLRTYSLPMLPPVAMLAVLSFHHISEQKKLPFWFVPLVILICIWSGSQFFRNEVQSFHLSNNKVLFLSALWLTSSALMILFKISGRTLSLLVLAFLLARPFFVSPIEYHHHHLKDISDYYYKRQFDRLIYIDTKRTADDPLVTYFFNGINLHPGDDFVMLRPEEHPRFYLNHHNRNSLILINIHHRNPDYTPVEDEISSKGVLMFENRYYQAYIW